jgi:hypothetical protein
MAMEVHDFIEAKVIYHYSSRQVAGPLASFATTVFSRDKSIHILFDYDKYGYGKEYRLAYLKALHSNLCILMFFGKLLECSNVEIIDKEYVVKRRRSRKIQTSRVIGKELRIKLPPHILRRSSQPVESHVGVALHTRRGHFADYRDGNGLFGKHKVKVWVPGCTVGSQEHGTITKTYKVSTAGSG